jgi:hypothetical protein
MERDALDEWCAVADLLDNKHPFLALRTWWADSKTPTRRCGRRK